MAATSTVDDHMKALPEASFEIESDYGTDIDDQDITNLLLKAESQPLDDIVLTSIEQDPVSEHAIIHLRSSGQEAQQTIDSSPEGISPTKITTKVEYSKLPCKPYNNVLHARD